MSGVNFEFFVIIKCKKVECKVDRIGLDLDRIGIGSDRYPFENIGSGSVRYPNFDQEIGTVRYPKKSDRSTTLHNFQTDMWHIHEFIFS